MVNSSLTLVKFKGLFKSLHPSLCLFANSYIKDADVSKDVVQEVFISVWEKKINFKNKDTAKAYLYTSVKNKCLDIIKSKRFRVIDKNLSIEDMEILDSHSFFFKEIIIIETSQIIENAVNTLPNRCSQIIRLSLKDFSNQEIAEKLSLSTNTVKAQKRIAYQKLLPLLKNYYVFIVAMLDLLGK